MPMFTFVVNVTISMATTVDAESLADAVTEAQRRSTQALCDRCAQADATEVWVTGGELDGSLGALVDFYEEACAPSPERYQEAEKLWNGDAGG